MKVLKTSLFLIVIAFLLMGQESCESGSNTESELNPFVGGTEALQVEFDTDRPPTYVESGGTWPFYIAVKLQNKGEAYVEGKNVKVIISGPNPADFGVLEGELIKTGIEEDVYHIQKDAEGNVREPAEVYVTFPELIFEDELDTNFQFNIRADVCYDYYTEARSNGCIVRDPTLSETQAYCKVKEVKNIYNSGAPIQVTKFEELPAGQDRIKYIFTVEHVGDGRFFLPSQQCSNERITENKVHFTVESRVTNLKCTPISRGENNEETGGMAGDVYLGRDGKVEITCIQQVPSSTDYLDQIKVKLTYAYLQNKEVPFMVKAIE
jgi:hypothetical protein